jgi:peroxiredoxin
MAQRTFQDATQRQAITVIARTSPPRVLWLGLLLLLAITAAAQDAPQQSSDPELDRVQAMLRQAHSEAEQYNQSGGKTSDANHPNRKWAATLWKYREEHPGTEAAARAAAEALHLLIHADQISEMEAKADTLKPDDAVWKHAISFLLEAAEHKKDYAYLISKTQALLKQAVDPEVKLRARFTLAQAYWKKGETTQARAAFQTVIAEHPNSPQAKQAEGNLVEMEYLNLGQTAPQFTFRSISGEPVSLASFKGKAVLLEFWATYCSACVADIPKLKELYAKHKDQGLVIIGVSLDDDAKALEEMIAAKAIPWPQIRNGKNGAITELFNVKGTPTYFLLDRDGKIAAKDISGQKLSGAIANLLKK